LANSVGPACNNRTAGHRSRSSYNGVVVTGEGGGEVQCGQRLELLWSTARVPGNHSGTVAHLKGTTSVRAEVMTGGDVWLWRRHSIELWR
jgi:hypothetical protein